MSHSKDVYAAVSQAIKDLNEREFSSLISSFDFFSFKFPELVASFPNEFSRFKNSRLEWGAFLREIRFWNEVGVDRMNRRLLQLCLRYIPKGEKFFKIDDDEGSFTLPTRLDRLNKITLLAKELVYNIFTRIENHLNFKAEMKTILTPIIRGTINWTDTITQSVNRGEKFPTVFSCNVNETNFDTPENLLAVLCLSKLQSDVDFLLYSKGTKELELNFKEAQLLKNIKGQIDSIVIRNQLRILIPKIKQIVPLSFDSKPVNGLKEKTLKRITQGLVKQKSYQDLLDWFDRYRSYYIHGIRQEYTNYPIEHEKTIDKIYELWVIFEMVTFLIEKRGVKFLTSMGRVKDDLKPFGEFVGKEKPSFAGFKLQFENTAFYLIYQGKHRGWTGYESEPDFTIQLEGFNKIPIVMDPKNWSSIQTGEAVHKMLGYLLNLSEHDATTGILFFSHPLSMPNEKPDPSISHLEKIRKEHEKTLSCYTMYLNPNKLEHIDANFEIVFQQIKRVLNENDNK